MTLLFLIGGILAGAAAGYGIFAIRLKKSISSAEGKALKVLEEAKAQARELTLQAKDEAQKILDEAKTEERERRAELKELESRLNKKDEFLTGKETTLEAKNTQLEKSEQEIEEIKESFKELRKKQEENLAKIAKLTKEQAREKIMEIVEKEYREDILSRIKKIEHELEEESDVKAQRILATAVQRMVWDHTAELTNMAVDIPNDEIKGRIIGKEGRNIQAFERATGVDLIVDDTPGTVVISSFDPIRRQIAKVALDQLVKDGRIQPARIEEVVTKAEKEVEKMVKEAGEEAVYELGITGLHPDLVKLLGQLNFRYSYGQNVLHHSKEVGWLAATIASEIGADPGLAKKGGLLHDIGKAVDHEVQGPHALIGADIGRKYGLPDEVIDAIEGHLGEVPQRTVYSVIAQVADAISGGRPGARRETLESYVKRIEELENIAKTYPGVDKVYAIQAGREIRVFVSPEDIDDLSAFKLAKTIAEKIEQSLKYPGQIKVTVIRETRAIEYAK